jgi:hypothetical protein
MPTRCEHIMFDAFECQCIYVEIHNAADARSGRVEYRAKSCAVCQARAALVRGDSDAIVAFEASAPRYERMH